MHFDKYAKVLAQELKKPTVWPVAVGIYAPWGSGKSSLLKLTLDELKTERPKQSLCQRFQRWMMSVPVVYAMYAVFGVLLKRCVKIVQGHEEGTASSPTTGNHESEMEAQSNDNDCHEQIIVCIFAKFDAWLFSDSNALWAILISKIFMQASASTKWMHHATMQRICFGRLTLVLQPKEEQSNSVLNPTP